MKDSLINRRLNGFYIESLLGRGGMARVYRGVDINLLRYVAIKVIDAPYRHDPAHITRFSREARVIAQLGRHPNVVQVYHYGEDQGYLFIAMQFVEGADLGEIMRGYTQDGERMPFHEIINVTRDICDALDYIHSQGVIHRDLKPSNIMLDAQGRAILADFGLALFTVIGTLGEAFGSPHYIPPEQAISSANAVAQSDLYSLGVILFELFTGRLPFDSDNPMNLAMLHMSERPPSPRSFRPELSPEIEAVILKTLAKNPTERYSSGRELYMALESAVRTSIQAQDASAASTAHLSIPTRVQRHSQPLPPPRVPDIHMSEPPVTEPLPVRPAPASSAHQEPPPTYAEPPLVIPVPPRRRSGVNLLRMALPLALMLAAVLMCAGGAFALSRLDLFGVGIEPPEIPVSTSPVPLDATPTIAFPSAQATEPAPPTDPPPPSATASPESSPTLVGPTVDLTLIKLSDNYLVVANFGTESLPLQPLRLGKGASAIPGAAWGVDDLEPGDCVVAMRLTRRPQLPSDPGCFVLSVLEGNSSANFWTKNFDVFYYESLVGTCKKDEGACIIQVPLFEQ